MKSLILYGLAAIFEISGCYCFWLWFRLHRSSWWLVPGLASLVVFALMLTQIEVPYAGRAFAAYGGIYIVASLIWLWFVERRSLDLADLVGSALCIAGAGVILFGPWRSGV